ncbi:metallophosphoesterase [Hoeflea sp.]|uniref:metallophosphoesterase n=1 Tax=Hoeflea sp. TaxID=1940281 RepID=UPI003B5299EC
MKLVHISDIHLSPHPILGLDPVANFKSCLAYVEDRDVDAGKIVITGDLTHFGNRESYHELRDILAESRLQDRLAPRLLIGNHDDREVFAAVFGETSLDANGFVQWTEETPAGLFVYLDTVEQGRHGGRYCEARMEWLTRVLDGVRRTDTRAYLFMHHNPVRVHVANADIIGIINEREFQALLRSYRDVIAHMFFGHCHYSLSGAFAGIPYSAPRSTNHACWPDFSGQIHRMGHGELSPNYNVCFLGQESTVVHTIDFLDAAKVRWEIETDESLAHVKL